MLTNLRKDGRLLRSYAQGKAGKAGFLDDYAFMTMAMPDLYEATFDAQWLVEADQIGRKMIELFADDSANDSAQVPKEAALNTRVLQVDQAYLRELAAPLADFDETQIQ